MTPACSTVSFATQADQSTNLKEVLAKKIPAHNAKVKEFRAQHGATVVQNISIDMVRTLAYLFSLSWQSFNFAALVLKYIFPRFTVECAQ